MFSRQSTSEIVFVTRVLKLGTHPSRQLESHKESLKHKEAMKRLGDYRSNVNIYHQLMAQEKGGIS